jgi:polysaccharide export outer membrane protein
MMSSSVQRDPLRWLPAWCVFAGAALVAGCSSLPMEEYSFEQLPQPYVAARRENPHTLEWSRLASASNRSDAIDRGDVLEVSIAAGLNSKDTIAFPVRVHENGVAMLPVIGPVPLAGLDYEAAEAAITTACMERELYRSPHVTVTMKRQRTNRVMVVGAVEKPAIYDLPRGKSDLLAAIWEAGGLAKDAGTKVEIQNPSRRNPPPDPAAIAESGEDGVNAAGHSTLAGRTMTSVKVDLVSATRGDGQPYLLDDGAIVTVEKRDPEPIFVQGLVRRPDRYEYPPAEELRLLGAISMAGGLSNSVADKVYIIRRKPNSTDTFVVNLKISDAKRNESANLLLAPGDVVSIEQTPGTVMMDVFQRLNLGVGATLPLTTFFGL